MSARFTTTLDSDWYVDPEIYAREMAAIFGREWLLVGHRHELERPGDYIASELAGADVGARFDLPEVHVEAMREQQRGARLDVRLDRLPVQRRLHHVGGEHGDQVGAFHRLGRFGDLEAIGLGLVPGRAVRAQADHHVEAGVAQVQRVRAALAAVAEHGDAG